jgi:hypothetical protein
MKLELLLQVIIPLTFLAIWALTSLLNRDAQPLPPRPGAGRVPGPGAARGMANGGFSPSGRPEPTSPARAPTSPRPASSIPDRNPPPRWSSTPVQGRPGSAAGRIGDDGIVIIESETRPTQGSSSFSPAAASSSRAARGTAPAARKAATRARSAPAPALKPIESERPRALTGLVGQSLSHKRSKPLDTTPLATQIAPISATPLNSAIPSIAPVANRAAAAPVDPPLSIDELRAMLASPKRLREVAMLGELLQPPVSLRGPRRPH